MATYQYESVFQEFEVYPFSDDPNFKAGLPTVIATIRGSRRSAAEIDEMIGRAQWFYFTRMKGLQIPWEVYIQSQNRNNPLTPNLTLEARRMMDDVNLSGGGYGGSSSGNGSGSGGGGESGSGGEIGSGGMSFGMLSRLISEGRAGEVGGIRDIPDTLNEAPPSESTLSSRAKPWETQTLPTYSCPQTTISPSSLHAGYQDKNPSYFTSNTSQYTDTQDEGVYQNARPSPAPAYDFSAHEGDTHVYQSPYSNPWYSGNQ